MKRAHRDRDLNRMKELVEYIALNDPTAPEHAGHIRDEMRVIGKRDGRYAPAVIVALGTACGHWIRVLIDMPYEGDHTLLGFTTVTRATGSSHLGETERRAMQVVIAAANHDWPTTTALAQALFTLETKDAAAVLHYLVLTLHSGAQAVLHATANHSK